MSTESIREELIELLFGKEGLQEPDGSSIMSMIRQAQEKKLDKLLSLIATETQKARLEWLDEQILHLLNDIYPEDLFTPPIKEDFDRINEFDANLHTRLHCDGIRHGLHVLRREVRDLSARDDLQELTKKG